MAIIYNDGKLENLSLDHNWGDVDGNGQTVYSGDQVQTLVRKEIKARPGYLSCISKDNLNNVLLGCPDESSYNTWWTTYGGEKLTDNDKWTAALNAGVTEGLILTYTIVSKGVPEDYDEVRLENKYISNKYISIDGSVQIPVRFTHTKNSYDASTGELIKEDIPEPGILTIQARSSENTNWDNATVFTMNLTPSSNTKDEQVVIDLNQVLKYDAAWQVRMKVTVDSVTATESGAKQDSTWIYYDIVKTKIDVNLNTSWAQSFKLIKNGVKQPLSLEFNYQGSFVKKNLFIEITGVGGQNEVLKRHNISLINDSDSAFSQKIEPAYNEAYNLYSHGIHNITFWIEIQKEAGDVMTYSTPKKTVQIFVDTDEYDETPYIIINNISGQSTETALLNWTRTQILECAVHAPDGRGGYIKDAQIRLVLTTGDGEEVLGETIKLNQGDKYTWNADLALELPSGKSNLWLETYIDDEYLARDTDVSFIIDNSGDYTPSAGADFIFNPRIRSNAETAENRVKIYNTADAKKVEIANPVWNGVKFNSTDGWVEDPKNGKCLRLLDKQTLTIPYRPFDIGGSKFKNTTIELSFAVKNIVDENVPLISICDKTYEEYESTDVETGETEVITGEVINGFELLPNRAYMLPKLGTSKKILDVHDVVFAEGEKIHMAICINKEKDVTKEIDRTVTGWIPDKPGETPHTVTLQNDAYFIRIYINGVLNRVVDFKSFDFDDVDMARYIKLGNYTDKDAADMDIYEIKVFHTDSYKKSYEILKDYISSLPTMEEKDKIIFKNSILTGSDEAGAIRDGEIDYNRASKMYNTLLWKPGILSKDGFTRPNGREFGDNDKKDNKYRIGDLVVNYMKRGSDGNYVMGDDGYPVRDEDRSGTLHHMWSEGQGTTSCLYFKWNQRYRFDAADKTAEDAVKYTSYFKANSGKEIEEGYDLFPDDPVIARLDGKVNWASSMQSHKLGSTALYNDLWKSCCGGNALTNLTNANAFNIIDLVKTGSKKTTNEEAFECACEFTGRTNGYGSCRSTVHQEPFLLFAQPTEDSTPIYYGPMTWGASKGDKPTFGYDKNFNKRFITIEGSDNFRDLISCNLPWDDYHFYQPMDGGEVDGCIRYISARKEDGTIEGTKEFEAAMGDIKEASIGSTWNGSNPCIRMFRDFVNFCYYHNPNIVMFDGNYDQLIAEKTSGTFNTYDFYWVTKSGSSAIMSDGSSTKAYDVFRWNSSGLDAQEGKMGAGVTGAWVPAGMYNEEGGYYENLNLLLQFGYVKNGNPDDQHQDIVKLKPAEKNDFFKKKRASRFKDGYKDFTSHPYNYHTEYPNGASDYVKVNELLFTLQFLKLIAGTDNWSKNTYIYNTGIYFKQKADGTYEGTGSAKYGGLDKFGFFQDDLDTIFEVDNYGSKTKPYYVEEHDYEMDGNKKDPYWNSEYNGMYCITELAYANEMKTMMRTILNNMSSLGGTPANCFKEYYQDQCQNYWPEVVYNTTAERFYMDGYYRKAGRPEGGREGMYLSQCLGTQTSYETEWQKKRCDYMSSYAWAGDFADGTSGTVLSFIPTEDITLELTPHIWMYPVGVEGSTNMSYTGADPETFNIPGRVKAGKKFTFTIKSKSGSENQAGIKGPHFYREFGNLARVQPVTTDFNINGERLTKFEVVGTQQKPIIFNPSTGFGAQAGAKVDNIRSIIVNGTTNGRVFTNPVTDLSLMWRLTDLDLRSANTKQVKLSPGSNLTRMYLPASIEELTIDNQLNLEDFSMAGYKNLKKLTVKDPSAYTKSNLLNILNTCRDESNLTYIELNDLNLKDCPLQTLQYLINIRETSLMGTIDIKPTMLDFNTKNTLINKFGNIDDPENDLVVLYKADDTRLNNITGDKYIYKNGTYQYLVDAEGNTHNRIEWSISQNNCATIDQNGVLTVNMSETPDVDRAEITFGVYLNDGSYLSTKFLIYFYEKQAVVGDLVYADGSLSSVSDYNPNKTIVGICYYVDGDDRRMMAVKSAYYKNGTAAGVPWGLSNAFSYNPSNIGLTDPVTIKPETMGRGNWSNMTSYPAANIGKNNSPISMYDITPGRGADRYSNNSPDDKAADGRITDAFKQSGIAYGIKQFPVGGPKLPCGQFNTVNIIEHRNEMVLKNKVGGRYIPGANGNYVYDKTKDELTDFLNYFENTYTDSSINTAALYPAATLCYLYKPEIKPTETLDPKFDKYNWYLPSCVEHAYMFKCTKTQEFALLQTIAAGVWDGIATSGTYSGPAYWTSCQCETDINKVVMMTYRSDELRSDYQPLNSSENGVITNNVAYVRACARF